MADTPGTQPAGPPLRGAQQEEDTSLARRQTVAQKIKFAAEYAALRAFIAPFRLLPVDTASALGGRVWRLLAPRNRRHARALEALARSFPDKSEAERLRIAEGMWDNLGRVMAEGFHLDKIVADPSRIDFLPAPGLVDEIEAAKGAVIVSMHFGNWEVAVLPANLLGLKAAGVYQPIKNPHVDDYVRRLRSPLYPGGLHGKAPSTGRRMLNWVRHGGVLALLADHRDNRGLVVPFFGRPAPSTHFPALVARSLGVPLVVGVCRRTRGARFEITAERIDVPQSGDRDADVALATARIQMVFERWIRMFPQQWMWGHKRWNEQLPMDPRVAGLATAPWAALLADSPAVPDAPPQRSPSAP